MKDDRHREEQPFERRVEIEAPHVGDHDDGGRQPGERGGHRSQAGRHRELVQEHDEERCAGGHRGRHQVSQHPRRRRTAALPPPPEEKPDEKREARHDHEPAHEVDERDAKVAVGIDPGARSPRQPVPPATVHRDRIERQVEVQGEESVEQRRHVPRHSEQRRRSHGDVQDEAPADRHPDRHAHDLNQERPGRVLVEADLAAVGRHELVREQDLDHQGEPDGGDHGRDPFLGRRTAPRPPRVDRSGSARVAQAQPEDHVDDELDAEVGPLGPEGPLEQRRLGDLGKEVPKHDRGALHVPLPFTSAGTRAAADPAV